MPRATIAITPPTTRPNPISGQVWRLLSTVSTLPSHWVADLAWRAGSDVPRVAAERPSGECGAREHRPRGDERAHREERPAEQVGPGDADPLEERRGDHRPHEAG